MNFEYRKNNLPEDLIFLGTSFKGKKGKSSEMELTINLKRKEMSQPTKIKLASTLKSISQTKKVWELIKESVL